MTKGCSEEVEGEGEGRMERSMELVTGPEELVRDETFHTQSFPL